MVHWKNNKRQKDIKGRKQISVNVCEVFKEFYIIVFHSLGIFVSAANSTKLKILLTLLFRILFVCFNL